VESIRLLLDVGRWRESESEAACWQLDWPTAVDEVHSSAGPSRSPTNYAAQTAGPVLLFELAWSHTRPLGRIPLRPLSLVNVVKRCSRSAPHALSGSCPDLPVHRQISKMQGTAIPRSCATHCYEPARPPQGYTSSNCFALLQSRAQNTAGVHPPRSVPMSTHKHRLGRHDSGPVPIRNAWVATSCVRRVVWHTGQRVQ